jgi:hypothetical protein
VIGPAADAAVPPVPGELDQQLLHAAGLELQRNVDDADGVWTLV